MEHEEGPCRLSSDNIGVSFLICTLLKYDLELAPTFCKWGHVLVKGQNHILQIKKNTENTDEQVTLKIVSL